MDCLGATISFDAGDGKIEIKPKHMYPIRTINICIKKAPYKINTNSLSPQSDEQHRKGQRKEEGLSGTPAWQYKDKSKEQKVLFGYQMESIL